MAISSQQQASCRPRRAPAIAAPGCGGRSCSPSAATGSTWSACATSTRCASSGRATLIGIDAPLFGDLAAMLHEVRPDTVIVCSRDSDHDAHIVDALEAGCDVITEKPMTTTRGEVPARPGGRGAHRAAARRRLQLPLRADRAQAQGAAAVRRDRRDRLGRFSLVSRYRARRRLFPALARLHAESSGSLFVHKATHHFDLLNWFLEFGARRGFRARRAAQLRPRRPVPLACAAGTARMRKSATTTSISARASASIFSTRSRRQEDGYFRDACVFREEIDIPDTMSADDRLRERRADRLFAQHLHADRGLPSRLQRATGPDRAPAVRAPALARRPTTTRSW